MRPTESSSNDMTRLVPKPTAGFKTDDFFKLGLPVMIRAATYEHEIISEVIEGSFENFVYSSVWVKYKNAKKKVPTVSPTSAWKINESDFTATSPECCKKNHERSAPAMPPKTWKIM